MHARGPTSFRRSVHAFTENVNRSNWPRSFSGIEWQRPAACTVLPGWGLGWQCDTTRLVTTTTPGSLLQ